MPLLWLWNQADVIQHRLVWVLSSVKGALCSGMALCQLQLSPKPWGAGNSAGRKWQLKGQVQTHPQHREPGVAPDKPLKHQPSVSKGAQQTLRTRVSFWISSFCALSTP